MDSPYRSEQLSPWIVPSILFHLFILGTVVLFEAEQPRTSESHDTLPRQTTSFVPITVAEKPDEQELLFSIQLPQSSNFGMTSQVSDEINLAQAAAEQEPPVLEEPSHQQAEPEHSEPQPDAAAPDNDLVAENAPAHAGMPDMPEMAHAQPTPPETHQPVAEPQPEAGKHNRQSSSPISNKMSLAKLAEGFLNYAQERRTPAIDINSHDINLQPMLQKIGWFLQNSFHLYNKALSVERDIKTQVTLHLELNADGSLVNCFLSPKSNIHAFDNNVLTIAKGAAPFPPLPKHVMQNRKTLAIKIPIEIDAKKGTHKYYFTFRG